MIRPILTWPNEALTETCTEVGDVGAKEQILAADLLETMYDADGRGLAAPQVGEMIRVFVMDADWKTEGRRRNPRVFVDPEIVETGDETVTVAEACLSLPGVSAPVTRPLKVKIRAKSLSNETTEEWLEGADAVIAQHEIDHLDGRMILDHLETNERDALLDEYDAQRA